VLQHERRYRTVSPAPIDARSVLKARRRGLLLRLLPVLVVFFCGFVALQLGVGFSERPGVIPLQARLYYTAGLFFLGGMDLGVPLGGPDMARKLLWIAYFLAPAVTASALLEAVITLLNLPSRVLWRLQDHVVIGGGGRTARLFIERIRQDDPHVSIVVVEKSDRIDLEALRVRFGIRIIRGDITSTSLLRTLYLSRARRVFLLTDNDFTNLEAAAQITELEPELLPRVLAHVSNIRMQRLLGTTRVLSGLTLINTHQLTAAHLVDSRLLAHFEATEALDAVVIAGFGRFGQTVLDTLQSQAASALQDITIIDRDAHRQAAIFKAEVGFHPEHRIHLFEGDISDPRLWSQALVGITQPQPVFVLASSDDETNLEAALRLSHAVPSARIIALSPRRSRFAEQLASTEHFEIVSTSDLLLARIERDRLA
jgi:voltage-gated potassium channel Kch